MKSFASYLLVAGVLMGSGGLLQAATDTPAPAASLPAAATAANVTVQEDDTTFTLSNGLVTAKVNKRSGDLVSLVYKGVETLGANSGHPYGYWSHDASSARTVASVTINPQANGGARAEVAVKGNSSGAALGRGPGGSFVSDIEIRYAMERGSAGVYTYCAFDHRPEYPSASLGEARYCAKLSPTFDWLYVSDKRNLLYPPEMELTDDKYNYTALQFDHPAFGWTSVNDKIGIWFINPTIEYLSGGASKVEFLCHRDTTRPVFAASILNYWRGSHYGGSSVDVAQGEAWTKVIGPFMIYCNAGDTPKAMYDDAMARARVEEKSWPYAWVAGVDYPLKEQRGTVTGRLVLQDSLMPGAKMGKLFVGLAHPDYAPTTGGTAGQGNWPIVDWQLDAKFYQFWVRGAADGAFSIANIRPGKYTLHAYADGVLGEFAKTDVTVEPGKTVNLGNLTWTPVRRGKQVWEIGVPNRTGGEFVKGDDYNHDGMPLVYRDLFPNDVDFVLGRSDYAKDWFYMQVPHNTDPNARPNTIAGGGGNGRATPWKISFDLPAAPKGRATLRLAICGAGTGLRLGVAFNDQTVATITDVKYNSTINRNGIGGYWVEREVAFDASLLKPGRNTLTLTVPAGPVTSGVVYDYLRLEIDESATAPATIAAR